MIPQGEAKPWGSKQTLRRPWELMGRGRAEQGGWGSTSHLQASFWCRLWGPVPGERLPLLHTHAHIYTGTHINAELLLLREARSLGTHQGLLSKHPSSHNPSHHHNERNNRNNRNCWLWTATSTISVLGTWIIGLVVRPVGWLDLLGRKGTLREGEHNVQQHHPGGPDLSWVDVCWVQESVYFLHHSSLEKMISLRSPSHQTFPASVGHQSKLSHPIVMDWMFVAPQDSHVEI